MDKSGDGAVSYEEWLSEQKAKRGEQIVLSRSREVVSLAMARKSLRFRTWIHAGKGRKEVLKAKAILAPSATRHFYFGQNNNTIGFIESSTPGADGDLRMVMASKQCSTTSAALGMPRSCTFQLPEEGTATWSLPP